MFSIEILSMIGSGIFGAIIKLFAMGMQNRAEQQNQLIKSLQAIANVNTQVAETVNKSEKMQLTRMIIVFSILSIIVGMFFLPIVYPDMKMQVMTEVKSGGSYIFGLIDTTKTTEVWTELKGAVVYQDIRIAMHIILGAYIGQSLATVRR